MDNRSPPATGRIAREGSLDGGLTLGGRSLDDEGLRRSVGALAAPEALIRIEAAASVRRVQQVTDLLVLAGVRRLRTEIVVSDGAG